MLTCSARKSVVLPLPSSPHCRPTITVAGIRSSPGTGRASGGGGGSGASGGGSLGGGGGGLGTKKPRGQRARDLDRVSPSSSRRASGGPLVEGARSTHGTNVAPSSINGRSPLQGLHPWFRGPAEYNPAGLLRIQVRRGAGQKLRRWPEAAAMARSRAPSCTVVQSAHQIGGLSPNWPSSSLVPCSRGPSATRVTPTSSRTTLRPG